MKIHIVKKGDTLYAIAQKYNVPLEELIKANPEIANPDEIDVGMKVKIPAPPKPTYELIHQHTVQQGDTLWKLSKAWGIPLADMIQANPQLKNPNVLLTGEVVNIPKLPLSGGASANMAAGPWMHGKKPTGVKAETGVQAEVTPEPMPLPQPLPEAPVMPSMKEPENLPVMPYMKEPENLPVMPYMKEPENLPVMPSMKEPENLPVMPYMKEPENLPAMPAANEPVNVPVFPAETNEPVPVLPEAAVNLPVMPESYANAPVWPVQQANPPYPMPYPHEHDLFAQYPVPAVEAAAQANPAPNAAPVAYPETAAEANAAYGSPVAPAYGYGYPYGYGHQDHYGYPYAHEGGYGPDSGAIEGAVGSVYHPMDISGYGDQTGGYGDISPAAGQTAPAATANAGLPGVTGYMPVYAPGLVSPAAAKPASGCCGGAPSAPTAVSPAATAMPSYPVMPSYPAMPNIPAAPTAVSPAQTGYYPSAANMPAYVSPAAAYPGLGMTGAPGMENLPYAYPYGAYPASPYGTVPASPYPYGYDGYPAYGAPVYTSPAGTVPHYPAPGTAVSPAYAYPAGPGMANPDPIYGPYVPGYPAVSPGTLGMPPIPPLREDQADPEGAASDLTLHSVDEPEPASAPAAKKRVPARKKKARTVRKASSRSKESLPWIR